MLGKVPFELPLSRSLYFVEIPNVQPSKNKRSMTFFWQEKLFSFLMRNYSANLNIEFFKLPYNNTVALGAYFKI